MSFAISATVMQTPARDELSVLEGVTIVVDDAGEIVALGPASQPDVAVAAETATRRWTPPAGSILLPGLVDLHVHAPQWPQLGTGLDLPLEQWLFQHTFPLEARYVDPAFAGAVWRRLVPALLAHGTTTAVYFATNDGHATDMLAGACAELGQRAFVGRVAMDHPDGTPSWYRDASPTAGVAASEASIGAIRAVDAGRGLVQPVVTPRFTPACTDALLAGLGELAAASGTLVQTHCSESDWAHGYALDRFGTTDASALDRFGLLREGTVLAHANHVTPDDASLLAGRRAGIAHCPLSNAYFANGVLPVQRLLDQGVRIGLGTDIAGGASPSLLRQCHDAVTVSRVAADGVDVRQPATLRGVPGSAIDTVTAFWLATLSGATVLGAPVGLLEVGRRFDAFLVDTTGGDTGASALHVWPEVDDHARTFEKIVRLAGPSDIRCVWVDGRVVSGAMV